MVIKIIIIRQLKLIFWIILILSLVGCTNDFNKDDTKKNSQDVEKNSIKADSNFSYLGMRLKDESASLESNTIFTIQTGEQFNPSLEIINGFKSEQKYRVIFLLNYKPINFLINGKEHIYLDTTIGAETTKKVNISFPKITDGQHDLTTIIIREPDKILSETDFRPGIENVIAHRSNIIVSTNNINSPEFTKVDSQSSSLSYGGNIFLSQGSSKDLNNLSPISIIDKENQNDIWLSFQNENEASNYAIITLNMQTTKTDVEFVTTNSRGIIKVPIVFPEIPTSANFVIIAIEEPFTMDTKIPLLSNKFSIK